jgi:predicted RNase H-like HicB family nuclease
MSAERNIHVPYVVERDEDGVWCARAYLRPGVAAYGDGDTEQAAIDDLREGLLGLVEEFGVPAELTLAVPAA